MNIQRLPLYVLVSVVLFASHFKSEAAEAIQKGSVIAVKSIQDFDRYLKSGNYIVAYFGAIKCGPCRAFHDTYYGMAKEYPDVLFLDITYENVPQSEQLLNRYSVRSFPTFAFFNKAGTKVHSFTGASDSAKGKIVAGIVQMKDSGSACPTGTVMQQSHPVQPTQPKVVQPVKPQTQPIQQPAKQVQPMQKQPMVQTNPAQPIKTAPVAVPQQPVQTMQQQPEMIVYYPAQEADLDEVQKPTRKQQAKNRFSRRSVRRRPRQNQNW